MVLARDHRLSDSRLWPYRHSSARSERPAIPASDRRGFDRDGVVWAPDHLDRLQTPRTVGMVRLMVLPPLLDGAPPRRIAARKRSRPSGRVHHTLACGPAFAHT